MQCFLKTVHGFSSTEQLCGVGCGVGYVRCSKGVFLRSPLGVCRVCTASSVCLRSLPFQEFFRQRRPFTR